MFGADELGLDLGTSTIHVVLRKKGIVLSEPAYVTYDRQTRQMLAVGEDARLMYGRTPGNIVVERPFREGWVHSFDLVASMLRYLIRQVTGRRGLRPRMLLAMPGAPVSGSEADQMVDEAVVFLADEIQPVVLGDLNLIRQIFDRLS